MRVIRSILANKLILVSLGFIFLIIIIIALASLLKLPNGYVFVSVMIVMLLWIIILSANITKNSKNAVGIEQSMKHQADAQIMNVRASKREEFRDLNNGFIEAINSLKSSSLNKQKGKAALYALPWYMFIGPPASGKTTAILNAGLDFPQGMQKEIKGVGGTRNCEWFFSSSAILLDTAGRYVTEDENKEEWYAFLEILKKYRTKSS